MAVFVDLSDDAEDEAVQDADARYAAESAARVAFETGGLGGLSISAGEKNGEVEEVVNKNRNSVTQVFGCYPAVTLITTHLDLNTLDNLSRTCRQIRANLLQYRTQLISRTLRCANDALELNRNHTLRYRARATNWYFVEDEGAGEGKVGECARDLVGGCRRCGTVVCRNCAIKPPAPILLHHRHRRLCPACLSLPLPSLLSPPLPTSSPSPLITETLTRSICHCATTGVWLCQPCGRGLRSADSNYDSIWRWRIRYGPALGEGEGSFECGRGEGCCKAGVVEVEVDCDAEDMRGGISDAQEDGRGGGEGREWVVSPTPSSGSGERRGAGYVRHEIEGIGGVVKKKLVRMKKVGACVGEWEDERREGVFMGREREGGGRSWCGWCWRVVPGREEREVWGLGN